MNEELFVTADLHFGPIKFREHIPKAQHDDFIISRWNSVVSKSNTVIVAGDISFRNKRTTKYLLNQLHGKKILVMGNHDFKHSQSWWREVGFDEVYKHPILVDNVLISHKPINRNIGRLVNFYGHIHDAPLSFTSNVRSYVNICVDHPDWDFRPVKFNKAKKHVGNGYFYQYPKVDGKIIYEGKELYVEEQKAEYDDQIS